MRWKLLFFIFVFIFFLTPFFIEEKFFFISETRSRTKENQINQEKEEALEEKRKIISSNDTLPELPVNKNILLDVPFVVQAPFGEWSEPRFQDGCEEASILMAMLWIEEKTLSQKEVKDELLKISVFGEKKFGFFEDTSATETTLFMKDFYGYKNIEPRYEVTVDAIKDELQKGNLVLVPVQGQRLKNLYYTLPGPERHMLVIRGYDETKKEFITNDPGTRHGEAYQYPYTILLAAILDYPSGKHKPILLEKKAMIVVKK